MLLNVATSVKCLDQHDYAWRWYCPGVRPCVNCV